MTHQWGPGRAARSLPREPRFAPKERTDRLTALLSGCVTGEDKVTSFGRLMARKAGFGHRLIHRFTVRELSESPAAGRGVLSGILDHELNISGRPRNERLFPAKDFVVLRRRHVTIGQPGNHCAIRERKLSFPI